MSTTSKAAWSSRASAWRPSPTTSAPYPSLSSRRSATFWLIALSSARRMRSGTGEPTSRAGRRVALVADRLEKPIAQMREPQGLRQPRRKAGVDVSRRQRLAGGRQKDEHRRVGAPHGADFSGERDPVHLGHLVIEKCHVEGIALYDPFERHGGRVCISGAHAPSLGLELQQKTIAGIVVDDQNALACQLRLLTVRGCTLQGLDLICDDRKVECRALPWLTLCPDPPTHEFAQPLTDGQPQTCPTVSARRRGIHLAENLE